MQDGPRGDVNGYVLDVKKDDPLMNKSEGGSRQHFPAGILDQNPQYSSQQKQDPLRAANGSTHTHRL
jgi:hypothetical protein